MEGDPIVGLSIESVPEEGLTIVIDEGAGPDDTVFKLHRNRVFIGNLRPAGDLRERKFVSDVLSTPCCMSCQMAALLADYDRRFPERRPNT